MTRPGYNPACFNVSADLQLMPGHQPHDHRPMTPCSMGRSEIPRRMLGPAHHRPRPCQTPAGRSGTAGPPPKLDYLLAVDDFSRVGALRLRDADGTWHRTVAKGRLQHAAVDRLERIYQASRAVERGQETAEDLRYLQGKGTSLGGMRPGTMVDKTAGWPSARFRAWATPAASRAARSWP